MGSRGSDIDHVLVGPAGVFTINTKHHPSGAVRVHGDTVLLNRYPVPYVRNSRYEATRAGRRLGAALMGSPPPVTGLVVLVGCTGGFVVDHQPLDGRVVLLGRRELVAWLRAQPARLSEREVARLHAVARRADTWHG